MNRTPIATRLQSLFAAAVVTLVMLAGIDTLTGHAAPLQMAAANVTQVAG